jgi:hypothetical protein
MAAAMFFLPVHFYGSELHVSFDPGHAAVFACGLLVAALALAVHVRLSDAAPGLVLATVAVAAALAILAAFGVFLLVLVGGGCGDDEGHVPKLAWVGGGAIYLAAASWGLQRPGRSLWAVPVSLLVGGAFVVGVAVVFTGSTGACLE